MNVVERLVAGLRRDGQVVDLRMGVHWTALVAELPDGSWVAGLASTQFAEGNAHGATAVRDAGRLIGRSAADLAQWAASPSAPERSIGFAAINALQEVDLSGCITLNAEEMIADRGKGRNVVIVGHFPFVPHVREVAKQLWVLELNPQAGDLHASQAGDVIPQADVVAITGMSLVNGTFEGLATLTRPDAFVTVLGPTTPLSDVLFDYGVDVVSGTLVTDIEAVLVAASQGAHFRQMAGRRLVTIARPDAKSGVAQ